MSFRLTDGDWQKSGIHVVGLGKRPRVLSQLKEAAIKSDMRYVLVIYIIFK